VLHLDVKPDNLMFDASSAVKVTDFGIARVISGDRTKGTVDGQVLGTPAYMSPEQARGDQLTPASDVYAAGVMLYELLSGELPWRGAESASELLSQRLHEDPIPLGEVAPQVPDPLVVVVMTSLSRVAEERYQRAEDFGVAIGEACADSWGPEWLDHAGVAIVGSERLSRAARTTSAAGFPSVAAAADVASPVPPSTSAGPASATTGGSSPTIPGASSTVTTGRVGGAAGRAGETVSGPRSVGGSGAHETVARGATPAGSGAHETVARGAVPAGEPPKAPATGAVGPSPRAGAAAPPTVGPSAAGAPAGAPQFDVVRAGSAEPRIAGADLHQLELADLIGIEDVLDPPREPWPALLLTGILFSLAVLVALVGLGGDDGGGALEPGQVTVAGVDVTASGRIGVDLSHDVRVSVLDPSLASAADGVRLEVGYLGIPVSEATAPLGSGEANIDPGIAQRTVAGAADARVVLLKGDQVIAAQELAIDATQPWYLSVPFFGGVLVLLLGLANLEASLKPLRSGRPRKLSYVGSFVWGALIGVSLVALSACLGFSEPTVPTAVVVAVLGAVGGVVAARARIGVARRRRVRRAVKRAEKTLQIEAKNP
jgi:serine/threonine-protein kinase